MASEMESATLSGWPLVTHSEVNSLFSICKIPFSIRLKIKNAHIEDSTCAISNPHLSLPPDLAPCIKQVAGFHRAVPSTTLDKACMQFSLIIAVLH